MNTLTNRTMDVVIAELERNLSVLESNYRQAVSNLSSLRQCVETDDLTRLLRRGAFMKKFQDLLSSSKAEGKDVQLLMVDVDHFKRVNDTHGHQTGDVVLQRISDLIKQYMRPQDLAGRYGGEEIIVAVQCSVGEVVDIAENIRRAIEHESMKSVADVEFNVTLSMGIASAQEFKFEADSLIGHADAALYRAKNTGRNKVVLAECSIQPAVVTTLEAA